jgi:hypothetical protein
MTEIFTRRPCSQPEPGNYADGLGLMCPECGKSGMRHEGIKHSYVAKWMPLEEVVQLAHTEAVLRLQYVASMQEEQH